MMKYKFLKLKYIIPSVLIIVMVTMLSIFFFGGLKKSVLAFSNEEFDTEGFTSFWDLTKEQEAAVDRAKLVGHNSNFVMMMNEDTTIISIYRKKSGWTKDNPTANADLLYTTAQSDGDDEAKSNLILEYVNENGSTNTLLSYTKSVKYSNITTGADNRYYKIRYNGDNSVDVLYSIGDFAPVIIPDQFNRDDFNEMFIGNTVFWVQPDSGITKFVDVYDANNPTVKTDAVGVELTYKDIGYCFNNAAALYLAKNGLATISYRGNNNNADIPGYYFDTTEISAEDEEKILNAEDGFWYLSNTLDDKGQLKAKAGVNYNTEVDASGELVSPVIVNPFLTSSMITYILGTNVYEPRDIDEEGNIITRAWYYINKDAHQRVLKLKSAAPNIKRDIYNYLYVGAFEQVLVSGSVEDGTAKYDYQYADHFYQTKTTGTYNNRAVYYDWNQDGKITSDERYRYGGYQLRDENGSFVYYTDEFGNKKPKQMGLLTEEAVRQNDQFGVESDDKTVAFDICLRFALTNNGMDVSVLYNSINEGVGVDNTDPNVPSYLKHNNMLSKIQVCKYMTVNGDDTSSGEIVLPDGSGCVIEFNSDKSQQYTFIYPEKRIYGSAIKANATSRGNDSETMMLPMYGFIDNSNRRTVVAIVKDGAAQTSISADYLRDKSKGGLNKYNYAYFTTYYRESEKVKVTSNNEYTKISKDMRSEEHTSELQSR